MKIILLTEGGGKLGFGHIITSLSIYQAFKDEGITPLIIVKGDSKVANTYKDINFKILDWWNKKRKLISLVSKCEAIIIDSLYAPKELYEIIAKIVKIPVYFDYNKRLLYPRGIVINRTIFAEKLNYPKTKFNRYLLGTKYLPLTRAFRYVPEKKINDEVRSILITFGGTDVKDLTPLVLECLRNLNSKLKKIIIIGQGFKNINKIKKLIDQLSTLYYHPSGETMKKLMLNCDIAISAGGQTLFELARIGVPTIAILTADNQKYNIDGLEKTGFLEIAGKFEDKDLFSKINEKLNKLKDKNIRKKKTLIGRSLIDGYGSVRIVNYILGAITGKYL